MGMPTEIETDAEPMRRFSHWIDLPAHAQEKHLRIEVARPDQILLLDTHQRDDRAEIFSRGR